MYMVQTAWPQADLVGVDMSTYKLAISQAKLEKKSEAMKSKVIIVVCCSAPMLVYIRGVVLGLLGRGGGRCEFICSQGGRERERPQHMRLE